MPRATLVGVVVLAAALAAGQNWIHIGEGDATRAIRLDQIVLIQLDAFSDSHATVFGYNPAHAVLVPIGKVKDDEVRAIRPSLANWIGLDNGTSEPRQFINPSQITEVRFSSGVSASGRKATIFVRDGLPVGTVSTQSELAKLEGK